MMFPDTLIREFDDVLVSGVDGSGIWHDSLAAMISTVSRDGCFKVWPHDEYAGDGSGKIWFEWPNVRQLILIPYDVLIFLRQEKPMKKLIALALLALFACFTSNASAQQYAWAPSALDAASPWAIPSSPSAPNECGCSFGGICRCGVACQCDGYGALRSQALSENKPFVIFVGMTPRQVPGIIVAHKVTLPGVSGPAVVVSRPDGKGWLEWTHTLQATAGDSEIRRAAGLEVSQLALPFRAASQQDASGCSS